eukprot:348084_1
MNATIINNTNQPQPSPNGTWNHGPMISNYNNLYYISWYNSPKNEAQNQRVLCKTSKDTKNWMKYPIELFPNITEYPGVYNEPFTTINNRFYASASVSINDNSITQTNKGYAQLMRLITYINNINDYNISSIFWLTSTEPSEYKHLGYKTYLEMSTEIINDMQIYFNSLFTENVNSVSTDNGIVIFNTTTSMYLLPTQSNSDYIELMLLLRAWPIDDLNLFASSCMISKSYISTNNLFNLSDCRAGTQMFVGLVEINYNLLNGWNHSEYQNICNWSEPVITTIPDAPARTCISNLPNNKINGGYYLIGNQIGNTQYEDRKVLTLAITDKSGLYFNSVYAIRYDPPSILYPGKGKMLEFAYPSAMWKDNVLYVVYDVDKENIQLSAIDLNDLY